MARIVRGPGGGAQIGVVAPEASGQSFKSGQLVFLNASGEAQLIAIPPSKIVGLANKDATGVAGTPVDIGSITPETLVELKYTGGTPVVGTAYGVANAGGDTVLNVSDTTNKCFTVVKVISDRGVVICAPVTSSGIFQWA